MRAKDILFSDNAHKKLCAGISKLAATVGSTLGPGGRNVIYDNMGWPIPTKDGVTVAREISLPDKWENVGVNMVKQVASRTCDDAGDGTTTATILANAIFSEGMRYSSMGMNPIDMQRGINKFVSECVSFIKDNYVIDIKNDKQKVKDIATVSANWDEEIGNTVSQAILRVGVDGSINIEGSKSYETNIRFVDGIQFDRGYISNYLINDESKQIVDMENPYVFLYKGALKSFNDIRQLLVQVKQPDANGNKRNLIIIADEFDADIITSLVANKVRGNCNVAAIKAPWFKDMRINTMEDLAIYMGTKYFDPLTSPTPIDMVELSELGRCGRVTITATQTTFIEGSAPRDVIEARIEELKQQKEDSNIDEIDRGNLDLRISQLCAAVAFIGIGANSEAEYSEKLDRYDDAIKATRAALAEGIVPGGSYSYIKFAFSERFKELSSEIGKEIADIMYKTLLTPFKVLMKNASNSDNALTVLNEIGNSNKLNFGYNIKTEQFENLVESGVVDPFKVTRAALENAASVAILLLTSSALITTSDNSKVIDLSEQNNIPSLF